MLKIMPATVDYRPRFHAAPTDFWNPTVRHEAPGIEWRCKDFTAGQSQPPGEAGAAEPGNAREGGSSPDNVRDGSALSDGPGPASSDEKAYERNRCLMPRKSRPAQT